MGSRSPDSSADSAVHALRRAKSLRGWIAHAQASARLRHAGGMARTEVERSAALQASRTSCALPRSTIVAHERSDPDGRCLNPPAGTLHTPSTGSDRRAWPRAVTPLCRARTTTAHPQSLNGLEIVRCWSRRGGASMCAVPDAGISLAAGSAQQAMVNPLPITYFLPVACCPLPNEARD